MSTLDNLRKTAKRWLKALRANDADARARLTAAYPGAPRNPALRDIQHALAREHGHASWKALAAAAGAHPSSDLETLLRAAGTGDVDRVAAVLNAHPDLLDVRGALGDSGLRTALHFGVHHEPIVRLLLERGANPNVRDEGDDAYPMHFAAERGELAIVRLLVEHGGDPIGAGTDHLLDVTGWAVCFDYAHHEEVARYLLAHGAPLTLFTATALGEADALGEIARTGVDVNQRMDRTNHRRTALHLAVIKKQPASLKALLDLGADPDLEDAAGLTPLDEAAIASDTVMVDALLEHGAQMTPGAAVLLGRRDDIERMMAANPELMNDARWGRLLIQAAGRASAAALDRILHVVERQRAGLTIVNVQDDPETAVDGANRYTALHAAAWAGNTEAAKLLLKRGADPRIRDGKWRATAAGWAAYAGHMETAHAILEGDVDIFQAIAFDRADRVAQILDRDPAAIDRPFKAYAALEPMAGQWWPEPDCGPLEWAAAQGKEQAARVLRERGAILQSAGGIAHARRVATFLQSACWDHHVHGKGDHRMYDAAARRLLAQDPAIATDSIYTAVVCGEIDTVRRLLRERPELAREAGGARRWTPILYLAYTRFTHPKTIENALGIANELIDAGANPNDFYMAGDARYSVLVGVAGEGEQDSPRQPYAPELFQLLLERGAEPFDIQVLYNTHFSGDILWWLERIYQHTIDTDRGEAWKDPDWNMLNMGGYGSGARFILWAALSRSKLALAEWALAHGANPNAGPPRAKAMPQGSLYEAALRFGKTEFAELLARYGATRSTPSLGGEEAFIQACFQLDRGAAEAAVAAHPEYLRSTKAIFEAAERDRPDVIALLLDLGVPADIRDRQNASALHHAAGANALRAAAFLIERGVEIDPRETNWGGTPMGWAAHGDRRQMMDFLSRYTRAVWALCFNGYIDRLGEVVRADPSLARQLDDEGNTLLWWLPDDDEKAMAAVELLLAAGVDPAHTNKHGNRAADWARQRGMLAVAEKLEATGDHSATPQRPTPK